MLKQHIFRAAQVLTKTEMEPTKMRIEIKKKRSNKFDPSLIGPKFFHAILSVFVLRGFFAGEGKDS